MYNLLVVDDEDISIRGIAEGIDWSELSIIHVFTAYDAEEARQIIGQYPIHVMISDIDMPKENGIELLAWVNEHSPYTKTIFLTGHADFKYAQQAVQLSGFDYTLKPVDHRLLKSGVARALGEIASREEKDELGRTHAFYYEQWNRQLPQLVELLWRDIFNLRISVVEEQLFPLFQLYDLKIDMNSAIVPVLISIEEWKQDWNARDEEIMTYGLKNAATEILLRNCQGHIIQEQNGMLFALLYGEGIGSEAVDTCCKEYINKCSEYLYSVVSCYIGEAVTVSDLRREIIQLTEMERCNVARTGQVFRKSNDVESTLAPVLKPDFEEWAELALQGNKEELISRITHLFNNLDQKEVDRSYLSEYYFGVIHIVFQLIQKKNLSPADIYGRLEWEDIQHAMKSLGTMKLWSIEVLGRTAEYMNGLSKRVSQNVDKIQQFIKTNLHLDLNREMIAEKVYLNPAYLSRLFRKETGQSLTDYMVDCRMTYAKEELISTNHKISDIAMSVGYCNFSHFSKLFKKMTGLTPLEFRRRYQSVR